MKKSVETRDIDDCEELDQFYPQCFCAVCGRVVWAHRYTFEHLEPLPEDVLKHKARPMHKRHSAISSEENPKTFERYKEIHQRGIYRIRFGKQEVRVVLEPGDTLKIEQIEKLPMRQIDAP